MSGGPYRAQPSGCACGPSTPYPVRPCRGCAAPVCSGCVYTHAERRGGDCYLFWFAPFLAPRVQGKGA